MGPSFAVQLAQKVGCSVGNLRLLAEIRGRVDHAQKFGHPLHFIQVAYDGFHIGQTVEAGLPCCFVTLFYSYLSSQLAYVHLWSVPADEQDIPNLDGTCATGRRRRGGR